MAVKIGFITITMDEKKQRQLYVKESERIRNITTWQEAMEEHGRLTYLHSVDFEPAENKILTWFTIYHLIDRLEERITDRRRKCCYYKIVAEYAYGKVLNDISSDFYFATDYKVGTNAPFTKAKDDGSFIKGFLDMAKKVGDKRPEKEITAPFIKRAKENTEKKQPKSVKQLQEEADARNKALEDAAHDYVDKLIALAKKIIKTRSYNDETLDILSLEKLGYLCGLFSPFTETCPHFFISSGMADAFFALKFYLPSTHKELAIASNFMYLALDSELDSFGEGFVVGLNESLKGAYPVEHVRAAIIREFKKIGKQSINSDLYDNDIYDYLQQIGSI